MKQQYEQNYNVRQRFIFKKTFTLKKVIMLKDNYQQLHLSKYYLLQKQIKKNAMVVGLHEGQLFLFYCRQVAAQSRDQTFLQKVLCV